MCSITITEFVTEFVNQNMLFSCFSSSLLTSDRDVARVFPAPGLCSLFARVCMVTTVNICKVIFLTTGLNHVLNRVALNYNLT